MFESRLSRALLLLGAAVGIGSVGVWALEVRLINLPDWMVRLAMLKLAFAGSFGLLAAGALLGRHARTRQLSEREPPQVGEAASEIDSYRRPDRERVEQADEETR
jgi:hypothetical protein